MTEDTHYTISQLAEAAGVTLRTIRYYTTEGLLPPPDTRGKYALYNQDHLNRLRLIARLKNAYLPLGEIKGRLESLTAEQVGRVLHEHGGESRVAETSSASEYIANVLGNQQQLRQTLPAFAHEAPGYAEMRAPGGSDLEGPAAPAQLQPGRVELPPVPAPAPVRAGRSGSLLRRLVPQRKERTPSEAQPETGETWQRVTLAPGIELHIREPQPENTRDRIQQLVKRASELFRTDK